MVQKIIDLSKLDSSQGFVIKSIQSGDGFGASNCAGDVNGDGIDDLIVGASSGGDVGYAFAGKTYIIFGQKGINSFDLNMIDGKNGVVLSGQTSEHSGEATNKAGDINKDGFGDIVIGAPQAAQGSGKGYVVFGKNVFDANVALANLDGTDGFAITGSDEYMTSDECRIVESKLGSVVSSAGDVNGDGIDDVIISAPYGYCGSNHYGAAYVIYGKQDIFAPVFNISEDLHIDTGLFLSGLDEGSKYWSTSNLGSSISNVAGDINGDGVDDFMVGDTNPNSNFGQEYNVAIVKYGMGNASLDSCEVPMFCCNDFIVTDSSNPGTNYKAGIGTSIAFIKNFKGDGQNGIAVGAPNLNPGCGTTYGKGAVFVIDAKTVMDNYNTGTFFDLSTNPTESLNLIAFDNNGCAGLGTRLHTGDINGDGLGDIVAGSYRESLAVAFSYNNITGDIDVYEYINGNGTRAVAACDINGDGIDDVILGGNEQVYVVFGEHN